MGQWIILSAEPTTVPAIYPRPSHKIFDGAGSDGMTVWPNRRDKWDGLRNNESVSEYRRPLLEMLEHLKAFRCLRKIPSSWKCFIHPWACEWWDFFSFTLISFASGLCSWCRNFSSDCLWWQLWWNACSMVQVLFLNLYLIFTQLYKNARFCRILLPPLYVLCILGLNSHTLLLGPLLHPRPLPSSGLMINCTMYLESQLL